MTADWRAGWKLLVLGSAFAFVLGGVGLGWTPNDAFAGGNCDGVGDTDNDQQCDDVDNCIHTPNANQNDSNGNGRGDACECGDFDGNGEVNTTDARLVQRCSVGEFACVALADVDCNGDINTTDARLIQRFSVGEFDETALSCAELAPC